MDTGNITVVSLYRERLIEAEPTTSASRHFALPKAFT
jgi:hypothetical protein